jgi:hypothetical protein
MIPRHLRHCRIVGMAENTVFLSANLLEREAGRARQDTVRPQEAALRVRRPHRIWKRLREGAKIFLTPLESFENVLVLGNVSRRSRDQFDRTARVQHRAKNVFIVATRPSRASIGRLIRERSFRLKYLLDLILKFGG